MSSFNSELLSTTVIGRAVKNENQNHGIIRSGAQEIINLELNEIKDTLQNSLEKAIHDK